MISGIYCIENMINKKKYIGKDKNIDGNKRWYAHISKLRKNKHPNSHLQSAWNKYGEENFLYYIVEKCSFKNLDNKEIYYIAFYQTNNGDFGYNLTNGGDGNNGWKPSEETKAKISISHMGNKNPMFGKKLNEKQLNAIIKSGENHWGFGKHRSQETKKKLRDAFLKEKSPVFGKKYPDSASEFFGVVLYNQKQTIKGKEYCYTYWVSQLKVDKKQYNLGYFKDEVLAAKTYDAFVIKNGLKNPLNFPNTARDRTYKELENLKI